MICGLYDGLQQVSPQSALIGFLGGPSGILKNKTKELTAAIIDFYRNTGGFDMLGGQFNDSVGGNFAVDTIPTVSTATFANRRKTSACWAAKRDRCASRTPR